MHRLSGHGHTGAGQQAQHHLFCKKHNNFLTFLLISAINFVDGPYCIPVIHLTDIIFTNSILLENARSRTVRLQSSRAGLIADLSVSVESHW